MSQLICIDAAHDPHLSQNLARELEISGLRTMVAGVNHTGMTADPIVQANQSAAAIYIRLHYNLHGGGNGIHIFHYPSSIKGRSLARSIHREIT